MQTDTVYYQINIICISRRSSCSIVGKTNWSYYKSRMIHTYIGVIYRYPHFFDWGVGLQYPHFSGRKGEEFVAEIKLQWTVFDRSSAPDPAGRTHDALPDDRVGWERLYFLPIVLSSCLGTQGRLVLLLNWYPQFLDQSYAPVCLLYLYVFLSPSTSWNLHKSIKIDRMW